MIQCDEVIWCLSEGPNRYSVAFNLKKGIVTVMRAHTRDYLWRTPMVIPLGQASATIEQAKEFIGMYVERNPQCEFN